MNHLPITYEAKSGDIIKIPFKFYGKFDTIGILGDSIMLLDHEKFTVMDQFFKDVSKEKRSFNER